MPLYQTLITAKPHLTSTAMARLAKAAANVVLKDDGIVRDVYSMGFHRLPHRRTQRGAGEYWLYGRSFLIDHCSKVETMNKLKTFCTDESDFLRHHTTREQHSVRKIVRVKEKEAFAENECFLKQWQEDAKDWVTPKV